MKVDLCSIDSPSDQTGQPVEVEEVRLLDSVRGIYYLEDGRSIRAKTQGHFELYDAEDKLILKTRRPFTTNEVYITDRIGVHMLAQDINGNSSVLNIESNMQRPINIESANGLFYGKFGVDHQTLFCLNDTRTKIYKAEYTTMWTRTQTIKILKDDSEERIKNIHHVGSNSLLIFIGNKAGDRIRMYLIHNLTKKLIKTFADCRKIEVEKQITPSHFIMRIRNSRSGSHLHIIDLSGGDRPIRSTRQSFTPDGTQYLRCDEEDSQELDWQIYEESSFDGRRIGGTTMNQDFCREIILKHPLRHPIYTLTSDENPFEWIRLMSDGTVESSGSWPAVSLSEEHKKLMVFPSIIWRSMGRGVYKKSIRDQYLSRLIKVVAKAVIK